MMFLPGLDDERSGDTVIDLVHQLTIGDIVVEQALSRPNRVALVDGGARLTFRELHDRVLRVASMLAHSGVEPGSGVLWLGQNSHRLVETYLATATLGGVFCPVNWRLSARELQALFDDFDPVVVVWQEEELGGRIRELARGDSKRTWIRHNGDEDEGYEARVAAAEPALPRRNIAATVPALCMYVATPDGSQRGALLSHQALLTQDLVVALAQGVDARSVFLASGPLFHIGTFGLLHAVFHLGGMNVVSRRAEPAELLRAIEKERVTHAFLLPPTIEAMRALNRTSGHDVSSLWPGEPFEFTSPAVVPPHAPWAKRPSGFGQTQTTGIATLACLGDEPGSGRSSPVALVRIHDDEGGDVAPGEVGEIVVRGPVVASGYHKHPELDAERQRTGWHRTGDLGRRNEDGSITFVGRRTPMIRSAAENIYPAEVEACIAAHPAVAAVCVIGAPDADWTQLVKAVVVTRSGAAVTAQEVIDHCALRLARYKKPRIVEFADTLPRLADGGIDRDAVNAAFGGGGYPGAVSGAA
jgi:acyl-CoA synthetase (AMP-forming)/AMP-acid ligase II